MTFWQLFAQGEAPQLYGLGSLIVSEDNATIGTVLATLTYTDNDQEDIGYLNLTLESATNNGDTYFEIVSGKAIFCVWSFQFIFTKQLHELSGWECS